MRRRTELVIDEVNVVTAESEVQDLTLDSGLSAHLMVTGTQTFTAEIYVGNVNDKTKMTLLNGSGQAINNAGYMYNLSLIQYDYAYIKLSAGAGAGTVKCQLTVKEL